VLRLNGIEQNSALLNAQAAALAAIDAEVMVIEHHLHGRERWFGKTPVQTATDWGTQASLAPYRATSGLGVFGVDANDEALVLGADDTPGIVGKQYFDAHRMLVEAASNANSYVMRMIYGQGAMAVAEAAGQYTEFMISEARKGGPIPVLMPRVPVGWNVWVRAKNATDDATIDFFIGVHGYDE